MQYTFALLLAVAASVQLASAGCLDPKGFSNCSGDKDPCALVRCKEGTQCVVNNCGGCTARCEEAGTMHIMTMPQETTTPRKPSNSEHSTPPPKPDSSEHNAGQCPDGVPLVNCFVDPCANNGPCRKDQKCQSNYCGGCNAICMNSTAPNTQHQPRPTRAPCPPGVQIAQCLADPCTVNNPCNKETETCEANYCGGCSAVCRTNGKKNAPEPSSNTRPAGSSCQFPPCIATLCNTNSTCQNNWKTCTGICVPLKPSDTVHPPNGTPKNKCGGVSPCASTTCVVNSTCITDWKSCTGKCVKRCQQGSGWNPKAGGCRLCQLGYVTDANENACVPCPKDTFYRVDTSGRKCLPCPQGTTTKGKAGQLSCSPN